MEKPICIIAARGGSKGVPNKNTRLINSKPFMINNFYDKDLKNHTKGLICYIGGEYNPLLILKLQNQNNILC